MALYTIRSNTRHGGYNSRPKMTSSRRKALIRSYLPDWLLCIVLAAIFFALDKVPGFKREFSIDDPTLHFPFAEHERVPPVALYFIAIIGPFVLQIAVNFLSVRSWWDFHNSTLGLLLSLSLTGAITQFTKITVGRPRPDVLSRCQPPSGITDPEYGLVTSAICTQTDVSKLRDGFRSFPSGHSSLSFAGLGFLAFYLAGKLHLFDERGHTSKAWISLTPFSAAALVAISRTMDYRHHWQDVLVGSFLGLVMSFFAYRQYYPPLSSTASHRPFSPRIKREEDRDQGRIPLPSEAGRSSDEEILPTARPGAGYKHHGVPGGSVGSVGMGMGLASERPPTHPAVPHLHNLHTSAGYTQYADDEDVGGDNGSGRDFDGVRRGSPDLRGGNGHSKRESEDLEMNGVGGSGPRRGGSS